MAPKLRDCLLDALKELPGIRTFHIHVLVSSPRKHQALFPFAQPRPRTYIQDILILASEQSSQSSPRIFVTAIEATLYHIPSTSCAIFYISKVDTTGQGALPSPTSALVKSLLLFHVDPATRPLPVDHIWVHLFARAQGQYLFPNSSEFTGKRPLTDVKLCGWWKRILSEVSAQISQTGPDAVIRQFYILPGFSQAEAERSLKSTSSNSTLWSYGHPYSQTEIPLPCPNDPINLGHCIPYFDDCPKSRFLDEIAYITDANGVKSPARKRPRITLHADESHPKESSSADSTDDGTSGRPQGELGKVSPDEFWERMSFRQECVAGAVTGFFTLGVSFPSVKHGATDTKPSPLAPSPGQVSGKINKRIIITLMTGVEFSTIERAIKGTETLENAIRGLCEGLPSSLSQLVKSNPSDSSSGSSDAPTADRRTPERELMSLISSSTYLAPPRTPPRRRGATSVSDISPNPFPEPETSLETYHAHIYGSIFVNKATPVNQNSDVAGDKGTSTASHVTVLAVRKKKKAGS